jgi:hypothetical protein
MQTSMPIHTTIRHGSFYFLGYAIFDQEDQAERAETDSRFEE